MTSDDRAAARPRLRFARLAVPPRVRDIPACQGSWGAVRAHELVGDLDIAIDELGFLWVNGDTIPRFAAPVHTDAIPRAVVCWTPNGIGLWVHRNSMAHIPHISRLDMRADQWLPVAVALHELPDFITKEGT